MRVKNRASEQKQVVLDPGDHFVSDENIMISTLLGSCVSACIYDPVNRVMGMNHFLLANRRYRKDGPLVTSEAGRYGIHAMELVINNMLKMGASRRYMKAKAFGGGNVLGGDCTTNFFCVGEVNSRFIKEFLENENIPLISSDLGGMTGRVIRFYGSDYSVYVRKIKKTESERIVDRDKRFWEKKVQEVEVKDTEIDLW